MSAPARHAVRRRLAQAALTGVLAAGALVGCGDEPAPEAEPYLLTDLDGSTAAPDAVVTTPAEPSPTPKQRSSPRPSPMPTPEATPGGRRDDEPRGTAPTAAELVAAIARAAGRVETVRVTIAPSAGGGELSAAVAYVADAYDASLATAPGRPAALFRRIGGTLYAGAGGALEAVDPADPRVAGADGALVRAFLAWEPLADLRAILESATDIEPGVQGGAGAQQVEFAFSTDLAALPRPSVVVPDTVDGMAAATLTLDADLLPVSLELQSASGETVTISYADWGGRVQITTPG